MARDNIVGPFITHRTYTPQEDDFLFDGVFHFRLKTESWDVKMKQPAVMASAVKKFRSSFLYSCSPVVSSCLFDDNKKNYVPVPIIRRGLPYSGRLVEDLIGRRFVEDPVE